MITLVGASKSRAELLAAAVPAGSYRNVVIHSDCWALVRSWANVATITDWTPGYVGQGAS